MKNIIIGICDDQPIILQELEQIIREIGENWDYQWELRSFFTGQELLEQADELTIAFLDIEMPAMDGIELGGRLNELNPECKIIMATGKVDRFKEAFKIHAMRFVTKPFEKEEIKEALEAAGVSEFSGKIIELYVQRNRIEIPQEEIRCIQSFDGYAEFTVESKKLRKDISLDDLGKILDERLFFRINRKEIINLRWVTSYKNNKIVIDNKEFIVSRRRRKDFEVKYIEYDLKYRGRR